MDDLDSYLRLCMREYAARQDLDEYWRARLLKDANARPGSSVWWSLLNPVYIFSIVIARLAR